MLVDHLLAKQPDLKVLFMSGYDDRQVVQRYVVEKGFRLLAKPFTIKGLRSAVEAEIGAGSLRSALWRDRADPAVPLRRAAGLFPAACKVWDFAGLSKTHARRIGLRGWVRNEDDGRVQVYAIGNPEQLDELAGLLHRGPAWPRCGELKSRKPPCNN